MAANEVVVRCWELSRLKETSAWLSWSVTAPTLPTSTPAMRTVSPACSPEALENWAT